MSRLLRTTLFVSRFVVIGLAVAFLVALFWPQTLARLHQEPAPPAAPAPSGAATTAVAAPRAASGPVSYATAVARAAPSVVSIYANKLITEQPTLPEPLRSLFGNIPTGPAYTRREQSLGSGVIISPGGYLLTNNHVIRNAGNIQVLLYDGRVAKATLVGADPDTDLAVLKVDVGNLPAIHLADGTPQVGDVVLAIGNPLGIGQTVTMGIVSATGRQLSSSNPEQFIQTDAAINFGNSGGALVNARGLLVGINTALLGHANGAEGIGFAIPVSTARRVMEQIIRNGHVTRSWMGISYTHVPPHLGHTLSTSSNGVIVTGVYPGSPADKQGLQRGDILLHIDGQPIIDPPHLYRRVSTMDVGSKVTLAGTRQGAPFKITLTLVARPATPPSSQARRQGSPD